MSFCNLTCTCGHEADIDEFTTRLGLELPPATFQCPACTKAWRVEKTPFRLSKWTDRQGKQHSSLISEPNKIVAINSYL